MEEKRRENWEKVEKRRCKEKSFFFNVRREAILKIDLSINLKNGFCELYII